ncbi:Hypothetical predicted protein [Octopus vulgaris]|uniref:Uncharacterized protein n=1 Tax=Octopus vulgaris TaxID=6645 RepID=A0AA36BCB4_OCTVU|nr:Hypothetical predicted protein [Octopus vulgaris]
MSEEDFSFSDMSSSEEEFLKTVKKMDNKLNEEKRNFADMAKCQENDVNIASGDYALQHLNCGTKSKT